jgi:hypothetical protein
MLYTTLLLIWFIFFKISLKLAWHLLHSCNFVAKINFFQKIWKNHLDYIIINHYS